MRDTMTGAALAGAAPVEGRQRASASAHSERRRSSVWRYPSGCFSLAPRRLTTALREVQVALVSPGVQCAAGRVPAGVADGVRVAPAGRRRGADRTRRRPPAAVAFEVCGEGVLEVRARRAGGGGGLARRAAGRDDVEAAQPTNTRPRAAAEHAPPRRHRRGILRAQRLSSAAMLRSSWVAARFGVLTAGLSNACFYDPTGSDAITTVESTGDAASSGSTDVGSTDASSASTTSLEPTTLGATTTQESTAPACGDGQLDPGEQCDDGDLDPLRRRLRRSRRGM